MLDQNTDRMWYVIGAIVIGAAIIAMGLNIFNDSIGSVGDMMSHQSDIARYRVNSINTVTDSDGIYTDSQIDNMIANGYIPITTVNDLLNVELDGKYIQLNDIDLRGVDDYKPIGNDEGEFNGTYDGGGFHVRNLKLDDVMFVGMFGDTTRDSVIRNVNISNHYIDGSRFMGGLVGRNRGLIENSSSSGSIHGLSGDVRPYLVGGLVGVNYGTISKSYFNGSINGRDGYSIGGITGDNYGSIKDVYVMGSIASNSVRGAGGVVGYNNNRVTNAYSMADVNGYSYAVRSSGAGSRIISTYYLEGINDKDSPNLNGKSLTLDGFKDINNFSNWDFDNIWMMCDDGYPMLRRE